MKAKDIRRGSVIMYNNEPFRVMDFHHHTPGNLRAMVQTKLRNIKSGTQTEVRFSSTEEIPEAPVFTYEASCLYADQTGYHFMNSETYDQIAISDEVLADNKFYLKEGMIVQVLEYDGNPLGITVPGSVILEVIETEPGVRGATVTNVMKPAKTETGLIVPVPAFVTEGDKIVVNTADGSYVKKAN